MHSAQPSSYFVEHSAWLRRCAEGCTPEGLDAFIADAKTRIAAARELIRAHECVMAANAVRVIPGQTRREALRKGPLEKLGAFLTARASRAQTCRELKVLVPALRLARVLRDQQQRGTRPAGARRAVEQWPRHLLAERLADWLLEHARVRRDVVRFGARRTERVNVEVEAEVAHALLRAHPALFGTMPSPTDAARGTHSPQVRRVPAAVEPRALYAKLTRACALSPDEDTVLRHALGLTPPRP